MYALHTDDTTLIHFTGSRRSFFISCNRKSHFQSTLTSIYPFKSHAWIFARSPLTFADPVACRAVPPVCCYFNMLEGLQRKP